MAIPSPRKNRATNVLTALPVLAAFVVLGWVRFSGDLDRALVPSPQHLPAFAFPPAILPALVACADSQPDPGNSEPPDLPRALATLLTSNRSGPATALKRAAFARLLRLHYSREEILVHYLNRACIGSPGGRSICGIREAARAFLGIPFEKLNLGEALLLYGLTHPNGNGGLPNNLQAALEMRNRLLARVRNAGSISEAQYEAEITRPLSLASDHRPIE